MGILIENATLFSDGSILPATSLLMSDGIIEFIGAQGEASLPQGSVDRRIDAKGALVHSSFADAHLHAAFGGLESNRCDLLASDSADTALELVRNYAVTHDEEWILGSGWHMPHFLGGNPRREVLDEIVGDRPVYLMNADHHSAWVNTAALNAAGITCETPDPDDGRIERDSWGVPTGTLHEGATALVAAHIPPADTKEVVSGLLSAQALLFSLGVTAWQDPLVGDFHGFPNVAPAYANAYQSGQLKARATGALWVPRGLTRETIPSLISAFEEQREHNESAGFPTRTAKIMVDGTAENGTALMADNYCGRSHAGLGYFSPELLGDLVPALNEAEFAAHFHAIGDRAVSMALDAVASVPERMRLRNHIAHIQVVNPLDVSRFAALGVTVNAQALWACNEPQMLELTVPLLGEERSNWQYPFGSLAREGAIIAMGSDWPVSTPDPWQAIHVAVTRQLPGEPHAQPLGPQESLSLATALDSYTRVSHDLIGFSDSGRLAVGNRADIVVNDRNPFDHSSAEIWRTEVAEVFLGGESVYRSENRN